MENRYSYTSSGRVTAITRAEAKSRWYDMHHASNPLISPRLSVEEMEASNKIRGIESGMARSLAILDRERTQKRASNITAEEIYAHLRAIYSITHPADDKNLQYQADANLTAYVGNEMFFGDPKAKKNDSKTAQSSGGDNSTAAMWNNVNTGIGAFDVGQGAKGELINYATKASPEINNLKYVKGMKVLGGVTFGVSSAISVGLAGNYYANGGTNSSVGIKAGIDIIMGGVGFLGPIGFGVSAAYFLLDASGAFGGYGDPVLTPKK